MNQIRYNNPGNQSLNFQNYRAIYGQQRNNQPVPVASNMPQQPQMMQPQPQQMIPMYPYAPPPNYMQTPPPQFPGQSSPQYQIPCTPPNTPATSPKRIQPVNLNEIFYHPSYEFQPQDAIFYYHPEIRVIRDPVTMACREHLVIFYETAKTIHMREWAKKYGLIEEGNPALPLILPDIAEHIIPARVVQPTPPIPELEKMNISEPENRAFKNTNGDVVINIQDEKPAPPFKEDFGMTVNMSTENSRVDSSDEGSWQAKDDSQVSAPEMSADVEEKVIEERSKSDSNVNKMRTRYSSDKDWRDFRSMRQGQFVGPVRSQRGQTFTKNGHGSNKSPDSAAPTEPTSKRSHYFLKGVKNVQKSAQHGDQDVSKYGRTYKKQTNKDYSRTFKQSDKYRKEKHVN